MDRCQDQPGPAAPRSHSSRKTNEEVIRLLKELSLRAHSRFPDPPPPMLEPVLPEPELRPEPAPTSPAPPISSVPVSPTVVQALPAAPSAGSKPAPLKPMRLGAWHFAVILLLVVLLRLFSMYRTWYDRRRLEREFKEAMESSPELMREINHPHHGGPQLAVHDDARRRKRLTSREKAQVIFGFGRHVPNGSAPPRASRNRWQNFLQWWTLRWWSKQLIGWWHRLRILAPRVKMPKVRFGKADITDITQGLTSPLAPQPARASCRPVRTRTKSPDRAETCPRPDPPSLPVTPQKRFTWKQSKLSVIWIEPDPPSESQDAEEVPTIPSFFQDGKADLKEPARVAEFTTQATGSVEILPVGLLDAAAQTDELADDGDEEFPLDHQAREDVSPPPSTATTRTKGDHRGFVVRFHPWGTRVRRRRARKGGSGRVSNTPPRSIDIWPPEHEAAKQMNQNKEDSKGDAKSASAPDAGSDTEDTDVPPGFENLISRRRGAPNHHHHTQAENVPALDEGPAQWLSSGT